MTRQLVGIVMLISGVGMVLVSILGSTNGAVLILGLPFLLAGALLMAAAPRRDER